MPTVLTGVQGVNPGQELLFSFGYLLNASDQTETKSTALSLSIFEQAVVRFYYSQCRHFYQACERLKTLIYFANAKLSNFTVFKTYVSVFKTFCFGIIANKNLILLKTIAPAENIKLNKFIQHF